MRVVEENIYKLAVSSVERMVGSQLVEKLRENIYDTSQTD